MRQVALDSKGSIVFCENSFECDNIAHQYLNEDREAFYDRVEKMQRDLFKDKSFESKIELIESGIYLSIFILDEDPRIRKAVAKYGYGLPQLANDPNGEVRIEVAKHGIRLYKLAHDSDEMVRAEVARQGYELDKLINDPCVLVREQAEKWLCDHHMTIEDYKQNN